MNTFTVPAGLEKCQKCGQYKGFCSDKDPDRKFRVKCSCDTDLCKRCGEPVGKYPPHSVVFDEERGLVSVPYFAGLKHQDGYEYPIRDVMKIRVPGG